jgi:two-component system alkaline phosphatase synthesis response regulator PhoP
MKKNLPGTRPKILGKRILVAEDEPGVREALVMLLSLDGHTVTQASDGRQALELFKRDRFDVVITDYMMPEMRGDALAANIQTLVPAQPVIMISAHAQTLEESGNPLAGVAAVLGKPFMLADLRDAISQVLSDQEDSEGEAFLPN